MVVACPQCRKQVVWDQQSLYRPFCSERCKKIDLGAWSEESYVITSTSSEPDYLTEDEK